MKKRMTDLNKVVVRWAAVLLIGLFPLAGSVVPDTVNGAETRYVKPSAEASVRRGQGTEFKIVAMVKDGTPVQLLESNDKYAKVRLASGKEGWILKRFLSGEPPLDQLVVELEERNALITSREEQARSDAEQLGKRLVEVEEELRVALNQRDQLEDNYARLEEDTADVVKIKEELTRVSEENTELKGAIAGVAQENDKLKKSDAINWFLAGAGVLLVGMILGRLTSKSRKRKPSLL